jgi:hypothetical protein
MIPMTYLGELRASLETLFSKGFSFSQVKLVHFLLKNWKSYKKMGFQTGP